MVLIDDFRKQTKETILDHMDRLGVNHAVYSTHLRTMSLIYWIRISLSISMLIVWLWYASISVAAGMK